MEKIPDNSMLVTMDVRSLYTNIPNKEGIEAVETTLKRKNIGTTIISTFLRLVLTLNNFVFNSQNYLQIKGCAMGTKCAPSYAKKLETKLYRKESDRQAYLHRKSEHPESLKRSIPFSQAFRLRRICSTNN